MSTALTLLDWYACGCGKVVTYATNNLPAGWHENRCDVCISKEGPAPARVVLSAEQDVRAISYHLDPLSAATSLSDDDIRAGATHLDHGTTWHNPDDFEAMFAAWRNDER
jgi:hypothetical protein